MTGGRSENARRSGRGLLAGFGGVMLASMVIMMSDIMIFGSGNPAPFSVSKAFFTEKINKGPLRGTDKTNNVLPEDMAGEGQRLEDDNSSYDHPSGQGFDDSDLPADIDTQSIFHLGGQRHRQADDSHSEMLLYIRYAAPFHDKLPVPDAWSSYQREDQHSLSAPDPVPTPLPVLFHAVYKIENLPTSANVHYYYDYENRRSMSIIVPNQNCQLEMNEHAIDPNGSTHGSVGLQVQAAPGEVKAQEKQGSGAVQRELLGVGDQEGNRDAYTLHAAENGDQQRIYSAVSEEQEDSLTTAYTHRFPAAALWMLESAGHLWVFSRAANVCRHRSLPNSFFPSPDYLADAKFLGQKLCGSRDGMCNVWAKGRGPKPFDSQPFIMYKETVDTKIPVGYKFFNRMTLLVTRWRPKETLIRAQWKVPAYCPRGSSDGIGQGEYLIE